MKKRTKWATLPLALTLAMSVAVAGCSKGGDDGGGKKGETFKSLGKDDKVSLKVAYMDADPFNIQYGNYFKMKYPNVDIEVIPTRDTMGPGKDAVAEMEKLIDEKKPDLVVLTLEQYEAFAAEGKLAELDAMIKQDNFKIDDIVPAVADLLKVKGGGKLYGLAPTFGSKALYYNKDLFDKYGIKYPTDQMSWEDMLQLAKRFPTDGQGDARIYGLYQPAPDFMASANPFDLAMSIGASKGLSFVDYDNAKLSINTDAWKKVTQLVQDAYKAGVVSVPAPQSNNNANTAGGGKAIAIGPDTFKEDMFLSGRAAMMINSDTALNMMNLSQRVKGGDTGVKAINWDVVTLPVDPQNPDAMSGFTVGQVFAITAQSANKSAAWELWKFINGDELSKLGSQGMIMIGGAGSLSSNKTTLQAKDSGGHHMEAFYKLKADETALAQKYPGGFLSKWNTLSGTEMRAVIAGTKTVDEALKTMQDKGQEELSKAKLDEQNKAEQKGEPAGGQSISIMGATAK